MLPLSDTAQLYVCYFVAFIFVTGVLVNAIGPAGIREAYARWGYPAYFRYVTALLEGLAAACILFEATRSAGLILGAAIMVAAVGTLIRAGEYGHTVPGLAILAACAAALI